MPESLRRRVKNVGLDAQVKGALVPLKSHYCRLITQESCCLHRYCMCSSFGTWIIQPARRTQGSMDTVAYGWALAKALRDITQQERAQGNPHHHRIWPYTPMKSELKEAAALLEKTVYPYTPFLYSVLYLGLIRQCSMCIMFYNRFVKHGNACKTPLWDTRFY